MTPAELAHGELYPNVAERYAREWLSHGGSLRLSGHFSCRIGNVYLAAGTGDGVRRA